MKAVVVDAPGGPEALRLREVPDPEPGPGEVAIDVAAAGVNRADLLQRQGHYPPPPGASEIIGLECSGIVSAVGEDVARWRTGDAVVALLAGGGYASRVVVAAGQVVPVPEGIDLVTAAGLIEVAATVASNLRVADLRAGQVLLVHGGAGGIGSFAIPYAKTLGARVLTTAGSPEKLDYCRALGADAAFSYREDWAASVQEQAPDGVDVILDVMGAAYLEANVAALAVGGRLVVIGMQGGTRGTLDLAVLLRKRGHVIATNLRGRPVAQKAEICGLVEREIWPLLADGSIKPTRTTTFALAEAAAAHRRLESGDHLGKVVLTV